MIHLKNKYPKTKNSLLYLIQILCQFWETLHIYISIPDKNITNRLNPFNRMERCLILRNFNLKI